MNCFELKKGSTRLLLADPLAAEAYYRGTRFDRSGIILELDYSGHSFVRPWFSKYDPYIHDAVSGPAEEFTQIGYENVAPGEEFLKIGVGILKRDIRPYDRFNLYEISDAGRISVDRGEDSAIFRQELDGHYDYSKQVEIVEDGHLVIKHKLLNLSRQALDFYVYSHNFFIIDSKPVNTATRFIFPFKPRGDWRAENDAVSLVDSGIAFYRELAEKETVFMGNLHGQSGAPFKFVLEDKDSCLSVFGACDAEVEYSVFWANHDVACIEPYVPMHILPGETACWTLDYRFGKGRRS